MQSSLPLCTGLTLTGHKAPEKMSCCHCHLGNGTCVLSTHLQPFRKWLSPIHQAPYLFPDAHAGENGLISASSPIWSEVFKPHKWHRQTGILSAPWMTARQGVHKGMGPVIPGAQCSQGLTQPCFELCLQSKNLLSYLDLDSSLAFHECSCIW